MRALTIVYILLACTVAGYTQTTASYDNVRARQQLTLNGHTLTSVLQTIDSLSTHAQGVTAKAVYDYIATKYSTVSAGTGIDVVKAGNNYTISLDTLKRLHFRTDSTYSGGVGTMRWNLTDGTLDLGLLGGNVTLQLGQESVQRVKHADNSGLVEGNVVYIVGSSGDNLTVRYARANAESTSANTFGVMTESASGGDKAFCTTFGLVRNINTSNLTEGGMVWLSKDTAGALTAVRPTAPNHGVEVGFCVRKHATAGVIFVTIQNGYELRELHDVYAPSPSNNQGLLWKSANSRWEAAEVDTSNTNEGFLYGSGNATLYYIYSNTNGSNIRINAGNGIDIFPGTNEFTINNTGDLYDDNEGKIGVGAGAANTSVITSNTNGANGVTVSGGTGIAVTETTSNNGGTITVTNSAPDQTVSLTNGGGVGVTGTYPSFTLTATDQSASNEGTLGVEAGTSTSSVITSNTSGATGVTINATGGISIQETTSSNGGSILLSATDQSLSNEGILGVAINPGADAWLRSNTSTANDIGLVGTNNTTITATASSNGGQIVIDSKAQIDTFSVSGSTLSLSLKNDGEGAKTVTLPGGGGGVTSLNSLTGALSVTGGGINTVGTSGSTITVTGTEVDGSITNELQTIDTFSLSGQTLRASLSSDGQAAKTVTLPVVGITAGTNVTVSSTGGNFTINATGGGGGGTPAGSAGQVQFNSTPAGSFAASSNLAWDNTYVRLNIGDPSTPTGRLNIKGAGATTTVGLSVTNSSNTSLIQSLDNGNIGFGQSSPAATVHIRAQSNASGAAMIIENPQVTPTADRGGLIYATGNGQTTAGANNSEFAITVSGPGSTSITQGPFVTLRGNNYSRNANQRGALFFYAGEVTSPAGFDGSVNFGSSSSYIDFQAGSSLASRLRIYNAGEVGVGTGSTTPSARLQVRGSNTTAAVGTFIVEDGAATPATIYRIDNDGKITYRATNTAAGTTGPQTINRPSGTVNFAAGATALVVTNSLCTTSSIVFATVRTNDATAYIKNVVPAAGSFTINLGAAATAETSVGFFIIN